MCVCVQVLSPTPSPGLSPLDEGQGSMRDSSPPRPAQRVADGLTEHIQPAGVVALPYDTPHTSTTGQRGRKFSCGVPRSKDSDHSDGHTADVARHARLGHGQSGGSNPPLSPTEGGRRGASKGQLYAVRWACFQPIQCGWPWTRTPRGCLPRNQHLLDKVGACRGRPARATCASEKASKAP